MVSLLTNLTNALRTYRMRRDLEGEVDEILKDIRYNIGEKIASEVGIGSKYCTISKHRGVMPSDRWQMPTRVYGHVNWEEHYNLLDLLQGMPTRVFLIEFDAKVNPETGKIDRENERVIIRSGRDYKRALNSYVAAHPQNFGDFTPRPAGDVWMPGGTFTINLAH